MFTKTSIALALIVALASKRSCRPQVSERRKRPADHDAFDHARGQPRPAGSWPGRRALRTSILLFFSTNPMRLTKGPTPRRVLL